MPEKSKYVPKRASKPKVKKGLRYKLKQWWRKIGTLNVILLVVFLIFLWFNYRMIELFDAHGSIPETYACAVVAALLGECGFCGWIRTNKDKRQDRKWSEADARRRRSQEPEDEEPPDEG